MTHKTKAWRAARAQARTRRHERKRRQRRERLRGHWTPGDLRPLGLLESRRRQPRMDSIVSLSGQFGPVLNAA